MSPAGKLSHRQSFPAAIVGKLWATGALWVELNLEKILGKFFSEEACRYCWTKFDRLIIRNENIWVRNCNGTRFYLWKGLCDFRAIQINWMAWFILWSVLWEFFIVIKCRVTRFRVIDLLGKWGAKKALPFLKFREKKGDVILLLEPSHYP